MGPCGLIPMTEMLCEGTDTLERPPNGTPTGRYAPFALEQHAHCSAMCRASLVHQAEWGTQRTTTTLPAAGSRSDTYMMDVDYFRSELESVGEAAASPSFIIRWRSNKEATCSPTSRRSRRAAQRCALESGHYTPPMMRPPEWHLLARPL